MKASEFIESIRIQVTSMKNKKGVQRLRSVLEKAESEHMRFSILMEGTGTKKLMIDKWLWRHGKAEVPYLDTRAAACKAALDLPAFWVYAPYDSIALNTEPYKYYLRDATAEQETAHRLVCSDEKAKAIYKQRHTGNINKIIMELQPEFLPRTYVDTNRRNEVTGALNIDLYAWDSEHNLGIVQVRQFTRGSRFNKTLKNYFLIGRNENDNAFCHSVPANSFRNSKGYTITEKVTAAQAWIFGVPFEKMAEVVRQGDMGLLCLKKKLPKNSFTDKGKEITIGGSHQLRAESILEDNKTGKIYALRPEMIHGKGQHDTICCTEWAEILIGRRYETHRFVRNSAD